MSDSAPPLQALQDVIDTVHRLRAPGGCAWDRAQTHQSLRPYLIEEAYETLDVLDQIGSKEDLKRDPILQAFREELGDVLMQVLLHSEMAREEGAFDFVDVARTLNEKLIRRHPHVFGEDKADTEETAFQTWEKQKAKEKAKSGAGVLDGLPKGLPALQRAARVLEKVTRVGFQWDDMRGPLSKVEEEVREFQDEVRDWEKAEGAEKEKIRARAQAEFGDVLFTLANVAYLMKISPEDALRGTLARFESRFRHVESRLREQGKTPDQSTLPEMDVFWDEAKRIEKGSG